MLPAYIIDEILRIEREKSFWREIFIERLEIDDEFLPCREKNDGDKPDEQKRGVVIIDFTI
jgi:hypothetical protein